MVRRSVFFFIPNRLLTLNIRDDSMLAPWSDSSSAGTPCRHTTFSTSSLAIVSAVWSGTGSNHLQRWSQNTPMYRLPCIVSGISSTSTAHGPPLEWASNRNRLQRWFSLTSRTLVGSTSEVALTVLGSIREHPVPPVVLGKNSVEPSSGEMTTKRSTVEFVHQALLQRLWNCYSVDAGVPGRRRTKLHQT